METAGTRRQREEEQGNNNNAISRQPTIIDNAHAMFDLAGGSVEDPLLATLIPSITNSSTLNTLLQGNNILLPRIELRSDFNTGMQFELGRSPDLRVPFRIDYARLSSKHCKFSYDASSKSLLITDTSTNGVWVNGERLKKNEPRVVKDRDLVSLLKPLDDALHLPFVVEISAGLKRFTSNSGAIKNEDDASNGENSNAVAPAAVATTTHHFDSSNLEAFQQEITCSVCLGTYIKPTCVLPCLHTFCQPCIRKYIAEQLRHGTPNSQVACPECRAIMGSIQLNHKVQALINEVTSRMKNNSNSDVERSAEEIAGLEKEAEDAEEKAKAAGIKSFELTASKTKKKAKEGNTGYYGGDSDDFEEEEEDEDYSDSDDDNNRRRGAGGAVVQQHVGGWGRGWGQGIGWGQQNHYLPGNFLFANNNNHHQQVTVCQSCRQPDARDGFQCPANGQHLVCKYCRTTFPDRPTCGIPQRCKFCATSFCDQYCGPCKNPAGVGILKELEGQTMESLPIGTLFRSNHVEIQHFQNYLKDNNIEIKDVWAECLKKFGNGEWSLDLTVPQGQPNNTNNNQQNVANNNNIAGAAAAQQNQQQVGATAAAGTINAIQNDTPVCKPCAQRIFASLLVRYRISIPRDKWPPAVGTRPDCWYGLECRTQHGNPMHAQKYNHVCIPRKGKE